MIVRFRSAVLMLAILLTIGCATNHHRPSHGPPLSEAMKKASNDHHGSRAVTPPERQPPPWQFHPPPAPIHAEPSTSEHSAPPPDSDTDFEMSTITGAAVEYGIIDGDDFNRMYRLELFLGSEDTDRNRMEVFIGGGSIITDKKSELNQSVKDVWLLDIGARYKWFTTPADTPMGHYFSAGFACNLLLWSYENNIERDGQTISGDSLYGMEFFAGTGLNLVQTKEVQVGFEVLPSLTLWANETNQKFRNDVFGPMFTIKFRVTFGF